MLLASYYTHTGAVIVKTQSLPQETQKVLNRMEIFFYTFIFEGGRDIETERHTESEAGSELSA